jgi:hypothetical protein
MRSQPIAGGWLLLSAALAGWPVACVPPEAPPVAPPSHPFRPAAGAAAITCSEPQGKPCDEGEAACESACGDGDLGSCLGLSRRLKAPPSPAPAGDDAANRAKRTRRSQELAHLACKRGLDDACQMIALDPGAAAEDRDEAFAALELSCQKAPGCACLALGEGLLADPAAERHARGIQVIDAACVQGAQRACDLADETVYRCLRESHGDPACLALERDRRTASPPAVRTPLPVPPGVLGCFQVRAPGAAHEDAERPDALCVVADRFYARDRRRGWNAWRCDWSTKDGRSACRGQGPLAELRQIAGGTTVGELRGERVVLRRLLPEGTKAAMAEIGKLPTLEDACADAARCVAAHGAGYAGPPANSVQECLALGRKMRAAIADDVAHGGKGSHPDQCPGEKPR